MTKTSGKKQKPYCLMPRDYDILDEIRFCGGETSEQVGRYHFGVQIVKDTPDPRDPSQLIMLIPNGEQMEEKAIRIVTDSNCQKRLKLMRDDHLIHRIEQYYLPSQRPPYLYTLTRKGAECLADYKGCPVGELQWHQKDTRLRPNYAQHLIRTNDVYLAIKHWVRQTPDMELVEWRNELALAKAHYQDKIPVETASGKAQRITLIPDAYFVLRNSAGQVRHHFLELDRGTTVALSSDQSYRSWAYKIRLYRKYFEGGLYEKRYGTPTGRLLTVTTSQKRLERLLQVSEGEGARTRFWFTTHDQITNITIQRDEQDGEVTLTPILTNILFDPIWVFAHDEERRLHHLCENFV